MPPAPAAGAPPPTARPAGLAAAGVEWPSLHPRSVINTTIADNHAGAGGDSPYGQGGTGGYGGGVYAGNGQMTFTNDTISGNAAGAPAAIAHEPEGPGACGGVYV